MLLFVKLSQRRYIVVDAPSRWDAWTSIPAALNERAWATDADMGYLSGRAEVIAGPASYDDCQRAAARWALEHDEDVTHRYYQGEMQTRAEALKETNAKLGNRR